MDVNKLKKLAGIVTEKQWVASVEVKKKPPEGLFTKKAEEIVAWLKKSHKEYKSAMAALNFYINRAGKNLPNKTELMKAKKLLAGAYGIKEDLDLIRKLAGIPSPVIEASDDDVMDDEVEDAEEGEEESKEGGEDDKAAEREELISSIADKAKEMELDELKDLLHKLYQAGYDDGEEAHGAEGEEETEDKKVEEAARKDLAAKKAAKAAEQPAPGGNLTSHVGIDKEDDAGWMAVELAKAMVPFEMEEAMGVFYFNFKNKADEAKAKKVAEKLQVSLV